MCFLSDLDDTGAVGIEQKDTDRDIVVARLGDEIRGYINRCPHLGTPLEMFPGRFLDETGNSLVCSTHGARFNVEDGYCTSGPCKGLWLQAIGVYQKEGKIFLDSTE